MQNVAETFSLDCAKVVAHLPGENLLGRIGSLEVRLARSTEEIEAAQAVRYRVFCEELGAQVTVPGAAVQRDVDAFDDICDHLIVCDRNLPGPDYRRVVGTYRLLPQERAELNGGFYSASEFELSSLVERNRGLRFVELGRSCVLPAYRNKRTIEAMWQAIWAYVKRHEIDVMAGCASFHGTVPAAYAEALSFLRQNCRAEGNWAVRAVQERFSSMDLMPEEAINAKTALMAMPPLIKGYLRLGARFGDGCVVDYEFGTTDVFVVLPVSFISPRYISYYSNDGESLVA
ncbi:MULTISPECIES: GNAT family N-acetyltransferase [Mesorhizobium]|uniref:L-ornithine N(alpha)-acyltransferase n=1 Tax=Mesorhizobium denitrificans TaxID=2294114 RepID=A0A371XJA1_9HYPH|nr:MULTISPECIES: GNAT family N-acetyltransferase [Mesorhizobium]RFC69305.1 GNAT family N-acetyltransferase [Mesorhizobium denitrificans]